MGTIYAICNKTTGKIYVGKTKAVPATKRWKSHLSTFRTLMRIGPNRHQNWTKLYLAMKSYGIENFEFVEMLQCDNDAMHGMETVLIRELDSVNTGYNIIEDSQPPNYTKLTDEQKDNHANGLKAAWAKEDSFFRTEEYKKLCSDGMKRAWSDPNSKLNSDESKQKRRNAMKGRKMSDEFKTKISTALKGNTYSRKKVEIDGVVYDSCTIAADALCVTNGTITNWLKRGKANKV